MPAAHFVYAGDPNSESIQAPFVITNKLYHFLKTKFETVYYYDWCHTGDITPPGPKDIVIAHPNYPDNTAAKKLFASAPCRAKCLIHPLHTKRAEDNLPFDGLARQADRIFSVCGHYWYDTLDQTSFAHWKPKITRLDLAVDPNVYPYVKTSFNDPGQRRLLYIGSSSPNKNLAYLVRIMQALPDVTLHWYGGDGGHALARLPNVKTVGWVTLDAQMAREICKQCDVMVSVSDSDANPTTTLECNSWGLAVACTKESGYYNDPMFTELYLDDFDRTIQVLRNLLTMDSEILKQRSLINREKIESHYTWDRFCNTIWDGLQEWL